MASVAIKQSYDDYRFQKNRMQIRFSLLGFILLFGITYFYDASLSQGAYPIISILRFGFVVPVGVLMYVLTYVDGFTKYYQISLTLYYMLVNYVLIMFLIAEPDSLFYYSFMVVIFIWGFTLLDLRVTYLVIANIITLLMILMYGVLFIDTVYPDVYQYLIYYVIVMGLLMVSKLQIERELLAEYEANTVLEQKSSHLENDISAAIAQVASTQKITIEALASLAESKDKTTGDHIGRVGFLCGMVARELPVSYYYEEPYTKDEFSQLIELASLLHDIGKIGVDPLILNKPGPLSDEERVAMQTHTIIGYETLRRIEQKFPKNKLITMGAEITRYHHENWDGTGYPDHLEKHKIPLSARIVAIVDVYDALMSKRPYKEAFTFEESIEIMKSLKYIKFDPKILDYFMSIIERRDVVRQLTKLSK